MSMKKTSIIAANLWRQKRSKSLHEMPPGLQLNQVIEKLNRFAPEKYAEPWDNVGLLIEPSGLKNVSRIFLTNDLTERVLQEAVEHHADLIISYHPLIFAPLKRITQNSWKERIVTTCLENRIALYSPHTAWDCIRGGVNDWLARSLPHSLSTVIIPNTINPEFGAGRLFTIVHDSPITLRTAIDKLKRHAGIHHINVALGVDRSLDSTIETVAVCAGSGSSVLQGVTADLYITGEMSHHELLDATHNNTTVLLCNHSNSERGFLHVFQDIFTGLLNNDSVQIIVSKSDTDPIQPQ